MASCVKAKKVYVCVCVWQFAFLRCLDTIVVSTLRRISKCDKWGALSSFNDVSVG